VKHQRDIIVKPLLFILLGVAFAIGTGCSQEKNPLIVYAGKGLNRPTEEIRLSFERRHKIPLTIVYAGSNTLLTTIRKTKMGDIFIPDSVEYIKNAKQLVTTSRYIANHIPAFIVRTDNSKRLQSFADLMQERVKIAVGNKSMTAIGRITEKIIAASDQPESFRRNIVVTGSTVNELLQLVVSREVDAALLWEDMLQWPEAKGLQLVTIPDTINHPETISVAVLATSTNPEKAALLANFVATEGKEIFAKHGFRVK